MNILITAIGKRVQLVEHLKQTFNVVGVDCSDLAPASRFVNKFIRVPHSATDNYVEALLNICHEERISLIIPLYECEFDVLSKNRQKFAELGTRLMLSDQSVLGICRDKWETYKFFTENSIPTPQSYLSMAGLLDEYPLFIKPRQGMGSNCAYKICSFEEFEFYFERINNPIIQKFIEGTEYTVDCLCDLSGKVVSIVPRERLEVISGEVSKTRTVHDSDVIAATKNVCNLLKGVGPLTIQCIKTIEGDIVFIEINPRFGGGVPATFAAGVDYGATIRSIIAGEKLGNQLMRFREVTMLRYSEAVFI